MSTADTDKGVKVAGEARAKVYRGAVLDHEFTSTTVYMFPSGIRIDGEGAELVNIRYPSNPGDGRHVYDSSSGFFVFYHELEGKEHSTRTGRISVTVSHNGNRQDGDFDVEFDTEPKLRVVGHFHGRSD